MAIAARNGGNTAPATLENSGNFLDQGFKSQSDGISITPYVTQNARPSRTGSSITGIFMFFPNVLGELLCASAFAQAPC